MLFRDTIKLITVRSGKDADGYDTPAKETEDEVFADVQSVKRSEFYAGRQTGVELTAAFRVRACDYRGQRHLEYEGKRYRVERGYSEDGEILELNCSEARVATT